MVTTVCSTDDEVSEYSYEMSLLFAISMRDFLLRITSCWEDLLCDIVYSKILRFLFGSVVVNCRVFSGDVRRFEIEGKDLALLFR